MPGPVGAGTVRALQSSLIGGVLTGWMAIPQMTFPPSAVHSSGFEVANARVQDKLVEALGNLRENSLGEALGA
jgi:hypothetical protein